MAKSKKVEDFFNVMEQVLIAKGYEISYEDHKGDSKAIMNIYLDEEEKIKKIKKDIKRVVKLLGDRLNINEEGDVEFTKDNGYETLVHNVHTGYNFRFYNY